MHEANTEHISLSTTLQDTQQSFLCLSTSLTCMHPCKQLSSTCQFYPVIFRQCYRIYVRMSNLFFLNIQIQINTTFQDTQQTFLCLSTCLTCMHTCKQLSCQFYIKWMLPSYVQMMLKNLCSDAQKGIIRSYNKLYTQKSIALYQVDISTQYCSSSLELFPRM